MESPSPILAGKQGKPSSVDFWLKRLYQNTFTRKGRQFRVRSWSVKIQHDGVRKAVTLKAEDKLEAAQEALTLFQNISRYGWVKALAEYEYFTQKERGSPDEMVQYWKSRLLTRRYLDLARGKPGIEFSVRIEHKGSHHYFLVGTDQETAAQTAATIYRHVLEAGWEEVRSCYEREFTIAIFWSNNPLACTYTTLITFPPKARAMEENSRVLAEKGVEVWFVGIEKEVNRAICSVINQQPNFYCGRIFLNGKELIENLQSKSPSVLLMHKDLPGAREIIEMVKYKSPELPVYSYGIYEESDQIFTSFSGINAGYILQRRDPGALFSPLEKVTQQVSLLPEMARKYIQHYFQHIFQEGFLDDDIGNLSTLTAPEQEIMTYLPHGLIDKEIAEILHVSYWTVHNHLKKIYQKLGVHNRTEAVVKYLRASHMDKGK